MNRTTGALAPAVRWLVLTLLVMLGWTLPGSVNASASAAALSTQTYDTPAIARVHELVSANGSPTQLSDGREPSASRSVMARGAGTTPSSRDIATNTVDDVIAETTNATSRNLTSAHTLTAYEALEAGQQWVGDGYTELGKPGSGVFRSADGTRQFRIDDGSLTGAHAPGVPHVHLETYAPGARIPSFNNHIPFVN